MGPTLIAVGVAFRVWAPHAKQVAVVGTFNNWNGLSHPMQSDGQGHWYAEVKEAKVGDQYKYQLTTEGGVLTRIDPYAREVTNSVGNAIVHNPSFNWEDDDFSMPSWNQLVILASLPVDSGSCDSTAIGMAIASCLMVLPVTISKLWR
jgi:1,4-alpha-glucan branching enzyme